MTEAQSQFKDASSFSASKIKSSIDEFSREVRSTKDMISSLKEVIPLQKDAGPLAIAQDRAERRQKELEVARLQEHTASIMKRQEELMKDVQRRAEQLGYPLKEIMEEEKKLVARMEKVENLRQQAKQIVAEHELGLASMDVPLVGRMKAESVISMLEGAPGEEAMKLQDIVKNYSEEEKKILAERLDAYKQTKELEKKALEIEEENLIKRDELNSIIDANVSKSKELVEKMVERQRSWVEDTPELRAEARDLNRVADSAKRAQEVLNDTSNSLGKVMKFFDDHILRGKGQATLSRLAKPGVDTDLSGASRFDRALVSSAKFAMKFSTALKVGAGIVVAFVALLGAAMNRIRRAIGQIMDEGFRGSQAIMLQQRGDEWRRSAGARMSTLLPTDEMATMLTSLARGMGDVRDVTSDIVDMTARATALWGVAAEDNAELVSNLRFITQNNKEEMEEFMETAERVQHSAGISLQELVQGINSAGETFYMFAREGARQFAVSAAALTRARVDIQAIGGFAANITSDFEGFLQTQASMQALFPGLDLTDTLMAAQFGSGPGQVASALQDALSGAGITNITQLPTSFQQALVTELGLPRDQLQKIIAGDFDEETLDALGRPMETTAEASLRIATGQGVLINLVSGIFDILASFTSGGIARFLAPDASRDARILMRGQEVETELREILETDEDGEKAAVSRLGEIISEIDEEIERFERLRELGSGAGPGSEFSGVGTDRPGSREQERIMLRDHLSTLMQEPEEHHVGGEVGGMINRFRRSAADEIPAMLQRGETILTRSQTSKLKGMIDAVTDATSSDGDVVARTTSHEQTQNEILAALEEIQIQETKAAFEATRTREVAEKDSRDKETRRVQEGSSREVVNKIDELITLLRGGAISVNLDGRKVTKALSRSNQSNIG